MWKIVRVGAGLLLGAIAALSFFASDSLSLESFAFAVFSLALLLGPLMLSLKHRVEGNMKMREGTCDCKDARTREACPNKAVFVISLVALNSEALHETGASKHIPMSLAVCEEHHPNLGSKSHWWVNNSEKHGIKIHLIEEL